MSINYSSNIIADVRCQNVFLIPGVGVYFLGFNLNFDIKARENILRFHDASAKVFVSTTNTPQRTLGVAFPESPVLIQSVKYSNSRQSQFEIQLSASSLAAIENLRNGGDLSFKLQLRGMASDLQNSESVQDEIQIPVSQSDWIKHLKQAGFVDTLLFEIPVPPTSTNDALKTAVDHLKKARDLFLAGHYDETVAKCRLALDKVKAGTNQEERQLKAVKAFKSGDGQQMRTEERLLLLREAAAHFTQLAHHDLSVDEISQYSRADSLAVLGVTAALLAHACSAATQAAVRSN